MSTTTSERVRGTWTTEGGELLVQVRCGGRGATFVGRPALAVRRDKKMDHVTLTDLVRDYGAGDVALFRWQRA